MFIILQDMPSTIEQGMMILIFQQNIIGKQNIIL